MGIFFVRPFGGSHLASKFMPKGCISIYLTHTKNQFSLKMPIYIRQKVIYVTKTFWHTKEMVTLH
jgi:hypothetical protein